MKKMIETDLFCYRQMKIVEILDRTPLIHVIRLHDFMNPLTGDFECERLQLEVEIRFIKIFRFLIRNGVDRDGKELIQKLEEHGKIRSINLE